MPSHEAELILSCKATGTAEVKKFNDAVVEADNVSEKLKQTVAGIFSAAVMAKIGKDSVRAWATQEKAVLSLESALRNQGAAYITITEDLMKFNAEMQKQTVYGDDQIALIQAQGLNMGITADKIKQATKAAIGLSAAYNMNLSTAMMLVARASQGQTQMLSRYGIVLGENLSPQEKYNKLLELGASKMSLAKDMTKTLEGSMAQMKNAVSDAQEQIGKVFAPTISALAGSLKGISEAFSGLPEPVQRIIVMTGTLSAGMMALKTAINIKAIAENLATGSSLAHTGAMKANAAAAKEQQISMAAMAEFASKMNANDIQRVGLEDALTRAETERSSAYKKKAEALDVLNNLEQQKIQLQQQYNLAYSEIVGMPDSDKRSLVANMQDQRKMIVDVSNSIKNQKAVVASLDAEYQKMIEDSRLAAENLDNFNQAREKEAETLKGSAEVNAAIEARNEALAKGKDVLEAQTAAEEAYNRVVAETSRDIEKTNKDLYERNKALAMGATDQQAQAVQIAAMRKQEKLEQDAITAAMEARNKVMKKSGDVLKAEAAAEEAYNAVVKKNTAEQQLNAQVLEVRRKALKNGATAAQADAVAEAYRAKAQKEAAAASSLVGRGIKGIGIAARTAGVAIKSMLVSMLPMLALSAAIEAVMWVVGKAKREAEAASEVAAKQVERVEKDIAENEKLRQQDQDKLRRYEELAKLSDRTASEHEELIRLATELNGTYNGLNVPLLKQNDILKDTSKLWDEINKKQREQRLQEIRKLASSQQRNVRAKYLNAIASTKDTYWGASNSGYKSGSIKNAMNTQSIDVQIKNLKVLLKAIKDSDEYTAVNDLLNALIELNETRKEYKDITSGNSTQEKENKDAREKQAEINEKLKKIQEEMADTEREYNRIVFDRLDDEKKLVEYRKQLVEENKKLKEYQAQKELLEGEEQRLANQMTIKSIELDIYKIQNSIADIEKKKQQDNFNAYKRYADRRKSMLFDELNNEDKLKALRKEYNALIDKADKAKTTKEKYEYEYAALDIKDQINNLDNAKKQQEKQDEQARLNIWQEMQNAVKGLRQTAQESVNSYSQEALRLQSRMFLSPKTDPQVAEQKKQNMHLVNVVTKLGEYERFLQEVNDKLAKLSENLGVTTY